MPSIHPDLYVNDNALLGDFPHLAGIDEAGRGPIAGPVLISAVILNPERPISGLNDSKQLSEKQREYLYQQIIEQALCYSIVEIDHQTIDRMNILQAVLMGMARAAAELALKPDLCLIDGNKIPSQILYPARAIIKGDGTYACIAAASILAKVTRDRIMCELDITYPGYGFARHKGYPTAAHISSLNKLGVSPVHRLSYKPVSQMSIFD